MTIKLYWSRGSGRHNTQRHNFGDWMSPLLCETLARKKVVYAEPKDCDLMAIGSIMKRLHKTGGWFSKRSVQVWGSGSIGEAGSYPSHHQYHAVRGPLTLQKIQQPQQQPVYGDPALLCEVLLPVQKKAMAKQYAVGIIPHYRDMQHPVVTELINKHKNFCLISVFDPVVTILQRVLSCELILSSSLHGLIVADALGIPNRWLKLSEQLTGGDFKFRDYYGIYGIDAIAPYSLSQADTVHSLQQQVENYDRKNIEQIKQNLLKAFPC